MIRVLLTLFIVLMVANYFLRVDLYALGATLYELLKGEPPFTGSEEQILRGHLEREPEIPGEWPKWLREVIAQSLAKRPEERFASATEMRRALRTAQASSAEPDEGRTERVPRRPRIEVIEPPKIITPPPRGQQEQPGTKLILPPGLVPAQKLTGYLAVGNTLRRQIEGQALACRWL